MAYGETNSVWENFIVVRNMIKQYILVMLNWPHSHEFTIQVRKNTICFVCKIREFLSTGSSTVNGGWVWTRDSTILTKLFQATCPNGIAVYFKSFKSHDDAVSVLVVADTICICPRLWNKSFWVASASNWFFFSLTTHPAVLSFTLNLTKFSQ